MPALSKLSIAAAPIHQAVKKFLFGMFQIDTVAATGSLISDAAQLNAGRNVVTAANGTKAVRLPPAIDGAKVEVVNTVAGQDLIVFPYKAADQINAITAGASFTQVGGAQSNYFCDANGHWYVAASSLTGTSTTSSTAELNYLDIAVLGTGAASKAVVLDTGEDYTWPATGVLTYGVLKDPAATTITATGAEINYLDIAALGTGAASKAVVLDGAGDYTWPATATIVMPSGGTETFQAGSTLAVAGSFTNAGNVMTTGPGAGFTDGVGAIHKNSLDVTGTIKKLTIMLDLTGTGSSTTDNDIIGSGASQASIGRILAAEIGTVLTVKMTCLEVPAGGVVDIDLYSATAATGAFDSLITDLDETVLITSGGNWTNGRALGATTVPPANDYLYLTAGAGGTPGTYTAGKFLIEICGY